LGCTNQIHVQLKRMFGTTFESRCNVEVGMDREDCFAKYSCSVGLHIDGVKGYGAHLDMRTDRTSRGQSVSDCIH
jgi:hypothetical protein